MKNIIGIIVSYVFIIVVVILAKLLEKQGKEASRKFIHIILSNWWFIAMYFFTNWIWASIVPLSFIIINYISYKSNLIKVMEREKNDGLGTVYYAISLFAISVFTFGVIHKPEVGLVSVLVMGYGDGLAGVVGRAIESKTFKVGNTTKSVAGSMTMFLITFMLVSIFLGAKGIELFAIKSIIIAAILTIVEATSVKGTDNLTVPLSVCIILSLM